MYCLRVLLQGLRPHGLELIASEEHRHCVVRNFGHASVFHLVTTATLDDVLSMEEWRSFRHRLAFEAGSGWADARLTKLLMDI